MPWGGLEISAAIVVSRTDASLGANYSLLRIDQTCLGRSGGFALSVCPYSRVCGARHGASRSPSRKVPRAALGIGDRGQKPQVLRSPDCVAVNGSLKWGCENRTKMDAVRVSFHRTAPNI